MLSSPSFISVYVTEDPSHFLTKGCFADEDTGVMLASVVATFGMAAKVSSKSLSDMFPMLFNVVRIFELTNVCKMVIELCHVNREPTKK